MNKDDIIDLIKSPEIRELFNEIWIEHIYLVWSYSRWDFKNNSDIDLLYQKNKNIRVWWIKFIKNKTILEEKLNKKIDLVNIEYIYKDLLPYVEKDKILIY